MFLNKRTIHSDQPKIENNIKILLDSALDTLCTLIDGDDDEDKIDFMLQQSIEKTPGDFNLWIKEWETENITENELFNKYVYDTRDALKIINPIANGDYSKLNYTIHTECTIHQIAAIAKDFTKTLYNEKKTINKENKSREKERPNSPTTIKLIENYNSITRSDEWKEMLDKLQPFTPPAPKRKTPSPPPPIEIKKTKKHNSKKPELNKTFRSLKF